MSSLTDKWHAGIDAQICSSWIFIPIQFLWKFIHGVSPGIVSAEKEYDALANHIIKCAIISLGHVHMAPQTATV